MAKSKKLKHKAFYIGKNGDLLVRNTKETKRKLYGIKLVQSEHIWFTKREWIALKKFLIENDDKYTYSKQWSS